jgi:carbonic anhydrase
MSANGTQNLEQGNRAYAADFTQGDLALPPSQKYAILTCMDARIDPAAAFGILAFYWYVYACLHKQESP